MLIYYILNVVSNQRPRTDTYGIIAHKLSASITTLEDYSLEGLTELCNVSPSSLSRFAKLTDYRNFSAMAGHLQDTVPNYLRGEGRILMDEFSQETDYAAAFEQQLNKINAQVFQILAEHDIDGIISLLTGAKKVAFFGFPTPLETLSLQMELGIHGIECTNYNAPEDQYPEMDSLKAGDVAVIYDCYNHDTVLPYLMNLRKSEVPTIFISSSAQAKALYKPDFFVKFPDMNLAMNLHLAGLLTTALVVHLQQ